MGIIRRILDVVYKPTDAADSEAIERLVDSQIDERGNAINHVASEVGNLEFQSIH